MTDEFLQWSHERTDDERDDAAHISARPHWLLVEDLERAEAGERRAERAHLDAVRAAFPPSDSKHP
jgi:hypothetical protein